MCRKWKEKSKWERRLAVIIMSGILVLFGIYIGNYFHKKEDTIALTKQEQANYPSLTDVKIVTLKELKGAFNGEVIKLTGFEETARQQTEKVTDVVRAITVDSTDSIWVRKGKEWFNGANTRELTANFSIDYGLGFDLNSLLQDGIFVDEYKGIVWIDTPSLTFTHFYIDPAYVVQEENGMIVSLFQNGFNAEEKNLLIKKMEERIKRVIEEDERVQKKAMEATKKQLTKLLEEVNPRITVQFR